MAHNFRNRREASTTARGYGKPHQIARRQAAERHDPRDPCSICRRELGPMGPWLHYDHTPNRDGYRGFAHAECNRRDGAKRGGRRRMNAPRTVRRRNWLDG
jgi:hypothetical protein